MHHSEMERGQMDMIELHHKETALKAMSRDGVLVCHNMIDNKQIHNLKFEINKINELVLSKIKSMDRPLKTYTDIAERELGRLDYRCGFTAEIFSIVSQPIIRLVNDLSPMINFKHYWGAIPSLGGSGPTNMHRDVYPITNNMKNEDLSSYDIGLPPYYFTALIPLVEITKESGPTQFIKCSHRKPVVDIDDEETYSPLLKLGDLVIFDGRTLHKGSANLTKEVRFVAYITFIADWYHDQTFTINDFLFPELQ